MSVLCPEGLPVELFLDNVMSEVRRALRQAESGAAPMTRSVGEDYGWRDRGWERGGSQFERTLTEKLREHGVGAVRAATPNPNPNPNPIPSPNPNPNPNRNPHPNPNPYPNP